MRHKLIFAALVLLGALQSSAGAWAAEWVRDGVIVTVAYKEPSDKASGATLGTLAHTNLYYQIPGHAPVKGPDTQATKPTGGGTVKARVKLPIPLGKRVTVSFWATATDKKGRESVPSQKLSGYINRRGR